MTQRRPLVLINGQATEIPAGDQLTVETALFTDQLALSKNSTGDSLKIGDDALVGDVDIANSVGLRGLEDPAQGFVAFGSGKHTLGYDGARLAFDGNTVWHGGNFDPSRYANRGGLNVYDPGSLNVFQPTGKVSGSGDDGAAIEVRADGSATGGAFVSFHRPNIYATRFGLNENNEFAFGGWSEGAGNQFRFWTENNLNIVTAQSLGLKGDGVTDDTDAWLAIPSKVADGTTITFNGTFIIKKKLAYSDKSIFFQGSGVRSCIIKFRPNNNETLLDVNLSNILFTFNFTGFTLMTNAIGNYAINITKPNAVSNVFHGPVIKNNEFIGESPNSNGWRCCIQLANCYNFRVTSNQAIGASTFDMDFLIMNGHSTDGTVLDNRVSVGNRGVWAPSNAFCEGVQISLNKFVGMKQGVFLDNGMNAPGLQISNNHFNCHNVCVRIVTRPQAQIVGNLLYKFANENNWVGIQFEGGSVLASIIGNQVLGYRSSLSGSSFGIVGSSSNRHNIFDNQLQDCEIGIDLTDSAAGIDDRNMFINCATPRQGIPQNHVTGAQATNLIYSGF